MTWLTTFRATKPFYRFNTLFSCVRKDPPDQPATSDPTATPQAKAELTSENSQTSSVPRPDPTLPYRYAEELLKRRPRS